MTQESIQIAFERVGLALLLTLLSTSVVTTASAADELMVTANAHLEAPADNIRIGRVETVVLHDQRRNKELQCRITYPSRAAGPCPIVIFSHGALGSKDNYDYLVNDLAAHDYVCIQPTHADSLSLVPKAERLFKAGAVQKALPHDAAAWDNRARDISLIIDSLPEIQSQIPPVMNTNLIACAGHSFGAFTTALIAGAEPPSPATRKGYLDKRVSAAIMMSGQGIRHSEHDFGFGDKNAWQRLTIPSLFLTGTRDNTGWSSYDKDRIVPFLNCPPGNKYFAVITGAAHMTFAGHGNSMVFGDSEDKGGQAKPFRQFLTRQLSKKMTPDEGDRHVMLEDICNVTRCFLDAYLKQEPQAKAELSRPHEFGALVDIKER